MCVAFSLGIYKFVAIMMKLDILICTIDEGIERVPDVLMPPRADIGYVVSMQWTREEMKERVPEVLREREDVVLTFLEGRGLCRNRNHALEMATGDVVLMADDDNRYTADLIGNVFEAYEAYPDADVIHFQALDLDCNCLHAYPADYVSSVEITFRRDVKVRFDERFGLGSEKLCSGEEEVWMKDVRDAGYCVRYVPEPIVMTPAGTTGAFFVGNAKLQMSKGATFRYVYGTPNALWRTLKEAGWWMVHRGANPFPILYNMLKGMVEV